MPCSWELVQNMLVLVLGENSFVDLLGQESSSVVVMGQEVRS